MGIRLTTKVQVSGWRFLLRRVEHALVRRDTRMFDDPLQFYGRSMTVGIVIGILIVVGAGVLAYFRPQGKLGDGDLFADRESYQLYVRVSGRLHPVYNLTSARLVLGSPADPAVVKRAELDDLPRGQSIGIPGAPYSTPVASSPSSAWALCDTVADPTSATSPLQTALIAMPMVTDPSSIDPIQPDEALLASFQGQDWLIVGDGRHAIDRTNRALTTALGINGNAVPVPLSEGLFNTLPDAGPWELPPIDAAGEPNTVGLPDENVIGSVFQTYVPSGPDFYVVMPTGVAPINDLTAETLRGQQSYGLLAPPVVDSSVVVMLPEAQYGSPLPDVPPQLLTRTTAPTLCWTWERAAGDQVPATDVVVGRRLPIPPTALNAGVRQIQGPATVYVDGGKYLRVQSPYPAAQSAGAGESLYYIDPQGVRYGLPDQQTAGMLGLTAPEPAPWQIVRLFVDGPVLSRSAALLEHDTLPVDPAPRDLAGGAG